MRRTYLLLPLLALLPLAACDGDTSLDIAPALSAGGGIALGPALALNGGHVCIASGNSKASDLASAENGEPGQRAAAMLTNRPLPGDETIWLLVIDGRNATNDHRVQLRGGGEWSFVPPDPNGTLPGLPGWMRPATCAPAAEAKLIEVKTGAKRAGRSYAFAAG
ncbi:hypothetical protein GE253_05900 [Niveispirillum sp. SYP-B3756]|uniref:hypothetical protein n=1 Tax=Niveispirillum sp. SYP-B3756 TaxID=2662178 RepID=UPI00129234C6|nr:hypothetical protein [Niveispirillum sp. SYP-B3756]MQP64878.1 hypothetical protein [Niveispirillum sp. SYP-B3756]